jgi:hypothetical protein
MMGQGRRLTFLGVTGVLSLAASLAAGIVASSAETADAPCWFDSIAELAPGPDLSPPDPLIGGPTQTPTSSARSDDEALQAYAGEVARDNPDRPPFGHPALQEARSAALRAARRVWAASEQSRWRWVSEGETRAEYLLRRLPTGEWVVMEEHVVVPDSLCAAPR